MRDVIPVQVFYKGIYRCILVVIDPSSGAFINAIRMDIDKIDTACPLREVIYSIDNVMEGIGPTDAPTP